MGGHKKSPSHQHMNMFGHLCKVCRCLVSRRQRKHSPSNKHKSLPDPRATNGLKSFDEELNEKNIARLRSTNDIHPHYDIPNSPKHTFSRSTSSTNHVSKKSALFRSASQTIRTQTHHDTLTRSLTRQSVNTRETENVGPLKKSNSISNLDTKAQSGPLFRSSSRNGAPDIVYSNLNGFLKLLTIEKSLECTLEDLCFGCLKKITIDRNAIASNGKIIKETETLSIKVNPGWKKGTKITFEGNKNEEKGTHSCDINFTITEKKHKLYRREGDDLELAVRVSLLQALTGCALKIPLLGGEKMSVAIDEIVNPGYEKIISGQGMPNSKENGKKGDLKLTFLVDFPTKLIEDRRSEIATILRDSF